MASISSSRLRGDATPRPLPSATKGIGACIITPLAAPVRLMLGGLWSGLRAPAARMLNEFVLGDTLDGDNAISGGAGRIILGRLLLSDGAVCEVLPTNGELGIVKEVLNRLGE